MMQHNSLLFPYPAFWLIAGITAIHLIAMATNTYSLTFDEAQYWAWSHHLDWGYYSKPPVIAWLIALSTSIFGHSALGVKLCAPLLHALTAWCIYGIACKFRLGKHTAAWSALLYFSMPAVLFSSVFFSTDVPMLFFWAVSLYAYLHILDNPKNIPWWSMLTLTCGLGLLSKYTMVLFGLSACIHLLSRPDKRAILWSLPCIMALAGVILIISPHIYWNAAHDFVTMGHTSDNVFSKETAFYPLDTLGFILSQLAVAGPVIGIALIPALANLKKSALCFFTLPTLIIGIVVSFFSGAQAHWVAPAYISGTLLAVHWLILTKRIIWLKIALFLHISCLIIIYTAPTFFPAYAIDNNHHLKWNALREPVQQAIDNYPDAIVASDERKLTASLTYTLRTNSGTPYPVQKWNPSGNVYDYFDMATDITQYIGKDIILVTRNKSIEPYLPFASHVSFITTNYAYNNRNAEVTIIYLQGFKGY